MHQKKFSDKTIKTAGTTQVVVAPTFQNPNYDFVPLSGTAATATGLVAVAKLTPRINAGTLPEFYFRWDDAGDELDVDIYIGGKHRKDLWEEVGYSGHKTTLVDPAGRKYDVNISIPTEAVFKGTIQVGLLTALQLSDQVSVMDTEPIIKIID